MWILTMRSPVGEPREYVLRPGKTTLGRKSDNDIHLLDASASRFHAEIHYDPQANTIAIHDLGSMNGSFVNHERLVEPRPLAPEDEIRIGEHIITLTFRDTEVRPAIFPDTPTGTKPLTRDLLLESLDHHAVLLYEVALRLNTVLDLDTALREVSSLMKVSMGADKCEVVLSERFDMLHELGFATSIARQAIDQRVAVIIPDAQSNPELGQSAILLRIRSALCVPVLTGEEVIALIYVYKSRPLSRPFDQRDLQLAVAISHQAALTIQRMRLLRRIRKEQRMRELLQRFLPPPEAEFLMQDYLQTGHLPEPAEQTLTVLFADIRDSTGLAERLGARRFGAMLGRYYQEMTDVIFSHGGLVNKYMGDGLMAVFGMSQKRADPEERAVRAGLTMLDKLSGLNRAGEEPIEIGIGVNTGPAMAGYLGNDERAEFTVLGDTVNVAAGLEALARPNRLFIGPGTHAIVHEKFHLRDVGATDIKKRVQPVYAYEVLHE
jgi:adenylate cyclase